MVIHNNKCYCQLHLASGTAQIVEELPLLVPTVPAHDNLERVPTIHGLMSLPESYKRSDENHEEKNRRERMRCKRHASRQENNKRDVRNKEVPVTDI